LPDDYIGLELLNQALGCLCRRQRSAGRIFILDLKLVAIHPGLVELFKRKLDALLVLGTEIRARARYREKRADLDRLVLRIGRVAGCQKADRSDACNDSAKCHGHFLILPGTIVTGAKPSNDPAAG